MRDCERSLTSPQPPLFLASSWKCPFSGSAARLPKVSCRSVVSTFLSLTQSCKPIMEALETIKAQLLLVKPTIQQEYHVTDLGIFGSYARGEQTEDSDIDVLVGFDSEFRFGLFTFCQLEDYLSEVLGKKVDLVMKDALKPHIGERILQEVIYL